MISKDEILASAVSIAQEQNIDHELVLAFIEVESSFYPFAHRFEPKWRYVLSDDQIERLALHNNISSQTERIDQMTSFGLMQVMGSVARELGYQGNLADLYYPNYGITYGCKKLKSLIEKYPDSQDDAISAYNAGTPTIVAGEYKNQAYVDAIKKALEGKPWTINQNKEGLI